MNELIKTKLKSIECKVINGRKIGIKATLEVEIEIYSSDELEIINEIKDMENIEVLKQELNVNSLTVDFVYDVIVEKNNPKLSFNKFWDGL